MHLENSKKINVWLWQKVWALTRGVIEKRADDIEKSKQQKRLSAFPHCSTPGIWEGKGQCRYIKRGKRYYIVLKLENYAYNKVIIGLGEDKSEAWIIKVGTAVNNNDEDYEDYETSTNEGYVSTKQKTLKIYSDKPISKCLVIKG